MTRKEAERQTRLLDTLSELGFTRAESDALRRISMTLHTWFEHECNGTIQRDGENGDGVPYWYHEMSDGRHVKGSRVPDRERGALKRLAKIVADRNARRDAADPNWPARAKTPRDLTYYVQGDPRGCALYILRPGDVPAGADVSAYYSRGIAVS